MVLNERFTIFCSFFPFLELQSYTIIWLHAINSRSVALSFDIGGLTQEVAPKATFESNDNNYNEELSFLAS